MSVVFEATKRLLKDFCLQAIEASNSSETPPELHQFFCIAPKKILQPGADMALGAVAYPVEAGKDEEKHVLFMKAVAEIGAQALGHAKIENGRILEGKDEDGNYIFVLEIAHAELKKLGLRRLGKSLDDLENLLFFKWKPTQNEAYLAKRFHDDRAVTYLSRMLAPLSRFFGLESFYPVMQYSKEEHRAGIKKEFLGALARAEKTEISFNPER